MRGRKHPHATDCISHGAQVKVNTPMSNNTIRTLRTRSDRARRSRSLIASVLVATGSFVVVALPGSAQAAKTVTSVALNESSNGRSVVGAVGTRLNLTLHSTYWSLVSTKTAPDLRQIGHTTVKGVAPNGAGHCVPGQGCGTVSAHYVAVHPGSVRLRATRTSCGEALRCSPAQSVWTVVVHVR